MSRALSMIPCVVVGAMVAGGWSALAQPPSNPFETIIQLDANNDQVIDASEVPESGRDAFDRLLKQGDANGDGKLQIEEIRGVVSRMREAAGGLGSGQRLQAMDSDKDGRVSRDEFTGPAALFDRLDANGDGHLDEAEARRAATALGGADVLLNRLKQMDANNDGKLTREEYQGPDAMFDRLDADGDGTITETEAREFQKAITERMGREAGAPGAAAKDPEKPALPAQRDASEAGPAARLARINEMDTDGDGKVTREEFRGPDRAFEMLDGDHDGVLTQKDAELREASRPGEGRARQLGPGTRAGQPPADRAQAGSRLREMDRDGDGTVTREEFKGEAALFDRLDTNQDGKISADDRPRGGQDTPGGQPGRGFRGGRGAVQDEAPKG